MADVILVVGGTGAGKTTYARSLANEIGALRFSIDDWMTTLFWMDSPQPIEFEWTLERIGRCEAMILSMVQQAASRGLASILDLGFTKREHRGSVRHICARHGLSSQIHFVDVDSEVRWARVEQRNREQGETFAMPVDRAMFDFMENMWEAPKEEELSGGKVVCV
ncbi:MAG: ATP-binding protein [Sphingomonadales bacterium]|nr:ATP-binding protein [Sphingomonadales bacterium]